MKIGTTNKILFVTATGRNILDICNSLARTINITHGNGREIAKTIFSSDRPEIINGIFNSASVPEYLFKGLEGKSAGRIRKQAESGAGLLNRYQKAVYAGFITGFMGQIESEQDLREVNVIFLNDIHPLGLVPLIKSKYPHIKTVWVNHREFADPMPISLEYFTPFLEKTDALIGWSRDDFPLAFRERAIAMPVFGIDPFDLKNCRPSESYIDYLRAKHNISKSREVILQMGRFAAIKDFFVTTRAFLSIIGNLRPGQARPQLVFVCSLHADENAQNKLSAIFNHKRYLVASGALNEDDFIIVPITLPKMDRKLDNEDKAAAVQVLSELAEDDQSPFGDSLRKARLHLRSNGDLAARTILNQLEVNGLQSTATLGSHPSCYEAFGMVITELLWKGIPTFGSTTGGIKEQYPPGLRDNFLLSLSDAYKRDVRGLHATYSKARYQDLAGFFTAYSDPAIELAAKMRLYLALPLREKQAISKAFHDFIKNHYLIETSAKSYLEVAFE